LTLEYPDITITVIIRRSNWGEQYVVLRFMPVSDLLIPLVMVICGRYMWKHCPKNINGLVGYRTARSVKISTMITRAAEKRGRIGGIIR